MSLALTSPLYQGTVLTDLIDHVKGIVPVSLDAVSGSAHPPSPEHWAACRNPWCSDLRGQWRLYGNTRSESNASELSRGRKDRLPNSADNSCVRTGEAGAVEIPQPVGACPKGHPLVQGLYCFTCAMKRDDYLETRCMECEREVEKVKGTDYCPTCLAKIQAEEL
jgi:hypothetical protein